MSTRLNLACFCTVFLVSSSLLFSFQPMVAKMLLPRFGGSSAVWTTCMLFFQVMLLAGYGYAHWISTRLPFRRQLIVHLLLTVTAFAFLPVSAHAIVIDPDSRCCECCGTRRPRAWPQPAAAGHDACTARL